MCNLMDTSLLSCLSRPCLTRIYEVSIDSSTISTLHYQFLREVYTPSPASIRAIKPKERLLALSLSSSVQLVRWSDTANKDATTLELSGPPDDLEHLVCPKSTYSILDTSNQSDSGMESLEYALLGLTFLFSNRGLLNSMIMLSCWILALLMQNHPL